MADKILTTDKLSLVCKFVDGDDRTVTLENPRADVSATDIEEIETLIKDKKLLLGDKDGADFSHIESAKITTDKSTKFDLS